MLDMDEPEVGTTASELVAREDDGTFKKGASGNPVGRPKGSKNKITLLKQSLELELRENASGHMPAILDKAIEMALEGDRTMLKLLLELHMTKGAPDDTASSSRPLISINAMGTPEIKDVTPIEETDNVRPETDE